jgi:hypothetical protein
VLTQPPSLAWLITISIILCVSSNTSPARDVLIVTYYDINAAAAAAIVSNSGASLTHEALALAPHWTVYLPPHLPFLADRWKHSKIVLCACKASGGSSIG